MTLFLLVDGCNSTLQPASGDPRIDLQHADPRVRIAAAEQVVRESRLDLCGLLLKNLSDRDGAVRLFSSVALRKLTGRDFSFKPYGTVAERREAIRDWIQWLEAEGLLARDSELLEETPGDSTQSGEAARTESSIAPEPVESADSPYDPGGLQSAADKPGGKEPPRDKTSDEKADDKWVGDSSGPTRS